MLHGYRTTCRDQKLKYHFSSYTTAPAAPKRLRPPHPLSRRLSGVWPGITRRLPRDYREIVRGLSGACPGIVRSLPEVCLGIARLLPVGTGWKRGGNGWERLGPVGSDPGIPGPIMPAMPGHHWPSLTPSGPSAPAFSGHFLSSPAMPGHIPAFSRLSCRFWPSLTAPAMPKPSPTVSAVPVMPTVPDRFDRLHHHRLSLVVSFTSDHARLFLTVPVMPDSSDHAQMSPTYPGSPTVSDRPGHASSATAGFLSAVP